MFAIRAAVCASFCLFIAEATWSQENPPAIWAQGDDETALQWSGAKGEVTGLVHSNGGLKVTGSKNTFTGGTTYVSTFENPHSNGGNANVFVPDAMQVAAQALPVAYTLADYMPGGAAAIAAGANYVDLTDDCSGGASVSFNRETIPGTLYWAPCDLNFDVKDSTGEVTVVASGKIHFKAHKDSQVSAFVDGVLALSASDQSKAIHLNGNKSNLHGNLVAEFGEIHLAGSNQTFSCGIFGDSVKISGSSITVTGEDCGGGTTNAPPLAGPTILRATPEDTSGSRCDLLANDNDSDGTLVPSSVLIVENPSNGSVIVDPATGVATYTPAANFFGIDEFRYTVADDDGAASQPALVTISVADTNDPPDRRPRPVLDAGRHRDSRGRPAKRLRH